MPAQEWVFCRFGVVERGNGCPPVLLVVAGRALLAEFTLVNVIVPVARDALGPGFPVLLFGSVTFTTRHPRVSPAKREVSDPVVEGVLVEADDIGAAPLVVCVTADAVCLHDIRGLAVKADSSLQVLCNILVAVETQGVLLGLRKGHMATAAVGLKLCMASDDRPRHHEFLDLQRVNVRGNSQRKEYEYGTQAWPGNSHRHVTFDPWVSRGEPQSHARLPPRRAERKRADG
jgi:hypothetical protein